MNVVKDNMKNIDHKKIRTDDVPQEQKAVWSIFFNFNNLNGVRQTDIHRTIFIFRELSLSY